MKNGKQTRQFQLSYTPCTVTVAFLTILSSFYLLFVGPGGYTAIVDNKFIAFAVLMGLYAAAYLPAAVLEKRGRVASAAREKPDPVELLVGLYVLFTLISAIVSPFGTAAWLGTTRREGFLTILLYGLLFYMVSHSGLHPEKLIYVVGCSMAVFCVICLLQFGGSNPFGLYPDGMNYFGADISYAGQYLGTIGNADLVAELMCIVIPWMLLYMLLAKKDIWRFWLLLPLGMCLWVSARMNVTAERLALALGLALSVPVLLRSRKRRCIAAGALAILLLALVGIVFVVDPGAGTLHELHEVLHGRIENSFGSYRVEIWKDALEIARQHLLFGSGADTMSCWGISASYGSPSEITTTIVDSAHNELLNILANQGIFALLSYVGAVGILMVRWVRRAPEHGAATVCGAACLCYLIESLAGISMCLVAPWFWCSLAILAAACRGGAEHTPARVKR